MALQFGADALVAVTGAVAPILAGTRLAGWSLPIYMRVGQVLDIGRAELGVRSYVAVGGGLNVPIVLGSASTDLLSGLGHPPLVTGDVLHIGPDPGYHVPVDMAPYPRPPTDEAELAIYPGPRHEWLSKAGLNTLAQGTWSVSPQSNRIALRLSGPAVERRRDDELPSEGIVLGSIQALPDGQLVIFLADHPTTGGYPVIGIVDPGSLGACAQARPGTRIRFRKI